MRDRKHKTTVDQREPVAAERRGNRNPIGAVAVDERGRGAVNRRVLVMQERDRNRFTIEARREQASRYVRCGIVTRGNFLAFAQRSAAVIQVVVPHFRRRRHRRVDETQNVGLKFEAVVDTERIGLFRKFDRVLLAHRQAPDDDARQTVLAFQPDQPIGEHRERQDENAWPMRDEILPVRTLRRRQRCPCQLEILGPGRIGSKNQRRCAAKRRVMFDIVANRRFERRNQLRLGVRPQKIDQPNFGCFMVMQRNDRKSPRLGIRQRNEILRIYALEDQAIVAGRRSETMAIDVRRTVLAVQPGVVERRAIRAPRPGIPPCRR